MFRLLDLTKIEPGNICTIILYSAFIKTYVKESNEN